MSNAIMPLADYKNACDTVREHTPYLNGNLIDGEAFEEVDVVDGWTCLVSQPVYLVAGKEYVLDFPNNTRSLIVRIAKTDWKDQYEAPYTATSVPFSFTITETAEYRLYSVRNFGGYFVDTTDATLVCTKNYDSIKSADMVDGINDVLDAGKKAEYDRFWDLYQEDGNRKNYRYAFAGGGWTDETFKPKYPIAEVTDAMYLFSNSKITKIDCALDLSNAPSLTNAFAYTSIERVKLLKVAEKTTYSGTFTNNSTLTDITFAGIIGKTVGFGSCPLNKASIISIIEHLSSTSTGQTLTLKKSAVDAAFETSKGAADGSTNPDSFWVSVLTWKPNWTITLA